MSIHLDFDKMPLTGWYPGHMLKAGREMHGRLELVDMIIELLDARAPRTSRNPALEAACGGKPRLLVFNKSDLADPAMTKRWQESLTRDGVISLFVDGRTGSNVSRLPALANEAWDAERKRRGATRPMLREIRLMVAGLPNIGKSTLVNRLALRHKAAVGPKPGVTRSTQWIKLQNGMELLDTPGVFWPRLARKQDELVLGLCGCIKDDVIGEELMVEYIWYRFSRGKTPARWNLYGLDHAPESPEAFLDAAGRRRGLLLPGGIPDRHQAAIAVINDFRDGRLGRITFDEPE